MFKIGIILYLSVTEKQKTQSLFLIKSSKGEIWQFNKGDSRNHPVAVWLGLEVSFIPQKPLGQQNPSALSPPTAHQGQTWTLNSSHRNYWWKTSLPPWHSCLFFTHTVFPFWLLLHIGLVNQSYCLGSTLGTLEGFSHFLAFSSTTTPK